MDTNWKLIRELLNAAIDTCERIEASGYKETDRDAVIDVIGQPVSVQDLLTSAWTAPESLRYAIIRHRHDVGINAAYVSETARILVSTAQAAAEMIGAGGGDTFTALQSQKMTAWFNEHAAPAIERAIAARRQQENDEGLME